MVPYDICSLTAGDIYCIEGIFNVQSISIFDEKGIKMSQWLAPGDFGAFDEYESQLIRLLFRNIIRFVVTCCDNVLMRTIFDMISNSYGVKTFLPCFLNPDTKWGNNCMMLNMGIN